MSKTGVSQEHFVELLRDGLTSVESYVILKQKSRSPVYLAYKPQIHRLTVSIIYVGGKLSAFPENGHNKWDGLEYDDRVNALKAAFRKLPQDRINSDRVGSNAGAYVAAGAGDKRKFLAKFDSTHFVATLLKGIEERLAIDIENRDEVRDFLKLRYAQLAEEWGFDDSGKKLPERIVGKKTEILFGMEYTSGSEVMQEFAVEYSLV